MNCNLCGNNCNIDRCKTKGKCGVNTLKIARFGLHYYEEPVISGTTGSGAVFFCGCPLKCVFCQNYPVSRNEVGKEITASDLAEIFARQEKSGANNINLVNPTHYVNEIIQALDIYRPKIPILYNTHGYDNVETIKKLKGYVDIYLPDFKYFDNRLAEKYSGAKDYFETASKAVKEMRNQVKDSYFDNGMMKSGLIIRHLILPYHYADSIKVLKYLSENFRGTNVSVMSQYTPCGDLKDYPELNRRLYSAEIKKVYDKIDEYGIEGFIQSRSAASEDFIPKWDFEGLTYEK